MITFAVQKFWRHEPSVTRSYSRLAGWMAGRQKCSLEFLKFIIDQIYKLFAAFSKVTALLE